MGRAGEGRRERLAAYLELHIEQGPVLEAEGLPCGAVLGTFGVERWRAVFTGRAGHAGLHPDGPARRRRGRRRAGHRALQGVAREHGGVGTAGRADFAPGIVTAVPGRADVLVDQRHLDPGRLAAMRAEGERAFADAAAAEGCELADRAASGRSSRCPSMRAWSTPPPRRAPPPRAAGARACPAGRCTTRRSWPGCVRPRWSSARRSAASATRPAEDTPEADLERALTAYGALVRRVVAGGVP